MDIQAIYPEGIPTDIYQDALQKAVFTEHWLLNQSDMDLYFDICGFRLRLPAGKRCSLTGWEQVLCDMETLHQPFYGASQGVFRGGFQFAGTGEMYIYDALVVFSPEGSRCGGYCSHHRSLEECIALINRFQLEKVIIIGDDLSFLSRCPSLKDIWIHYPQVAERCIDLTPVYEMNHIRTFSCTAPPEHIPGKNISPIDYTRMPGLRHLSVYGEKNGNFNLVPSLESLFLTGDSTYADLSNISCNPRFKAIDFLQCGIRSLNGIGKYPMQQVSLSYLRRLEDISALAETGSTLRSLSIDACGKISDFSCLHELVHLEHLVLLGSNHLPSLDFLRKMPKLKTFVFSMEVDDGDLTPCLSIPYASCNKIKRHYNLKEKDLPKTKITVPFRLK